MQGIFIDQRRPKSKKEIKEVVAENPSRVYVEATSMFGNEYDGSLSNMPVGHRISFVGPDPERKRNFYGTIQRTSDKFRVA